jgi:hypothetical protein
MSLLDAIDQNRLREPFQGKCIDEGCPNLPLINRKPRSGGHIDFVGRSDCLDAGSQSNRITKQITFLVQNVAEGDDDAHREAILPFVQLRAP